MPPDASSSTGGNQPAVAPIASTWKSLQIPVKADGDLPEDTPVIYDVSITANAHKEIHHDVHTPCPIEGPYEALAQSIDDALEGRSPMPDTIRAALATTRFKRVGLDIDSDEDDVVNPMQSLDVEGAPVSAHGKQQASAAAQKPVNTSGASGVESQLPAEMDELFDGATALSSEAERAWVEEGVALVSSGVACAVFDRNYSQYQCTPPCPPP